MFFIDLDVSYSRYLITGNTMELFQIYLLKKMNKNIIAKNVLKYNNCYSSRLRDPLTC